MTQQPPTRTLSLWLTLAGLVALVGGTAWWFLSGGPPTPAPPDSTFTSEPEVPDGPPWFSDRTPGSGVNFTHRNGEEANLYTILESLGGGVALLDFDRDGRLDLFFPGGGTFEGKTIKGHPCKFYRNLGDWKFQDITAQVGLDRIDFYSHGCAVADYDRDGWPDLVVTGFGRVMLLHNNAGKAFEDVTEKAGVRDTSWATSAGWADLTGSGYPDLYICHYCDWSFANDPVCKAQSAGHERDVCPPQQFKPLQHALFRNQGDGTFRDVTQEMGLQKDGCGLGVVLADFTLDGRPDVYVANDATRNHFYVNNNGKLQEKALLAGVAADENGLYNGSMGVDVGDFTEEGRPSLFVTNFQGETHALYQNLGTDRFAYRSGPAQIAALGRQYVGFGTSFIDGDNDGWQDLVIVNGHVLRYPSGSPREQKPLLLRNIERNSRRVFQNWSKRGGPFFDTPAIGRGIAIGDLDNDGWPDAVVSNTNTPAVLLRNENGGKSSAHWVGLALHGKDHRDVTGSRVVLHTESRTLTRFCKGGGSYLSASDPRILIGLGSSERIKSLTVHWSWGAEQRFENLAVDQYWELHEGRAEARPVTVR